MRSPADAVRHDAQHRVEQRQHGVGQGRSTEARRAAWWCALPVFFSWLKRPPAVSFHWSLTSNEACAKAEYSLLFWREDARIGGLAEEVGEAQRGVCGVPPSAVLAAKDCASTGITRLVVGTCR